MTSIRPTVVGLVVVAISAGATLVATTALGVTFQGAGSTDLTGTSLSGDRLVVKSRDRVSICVDTAVASDQVVSIPTAKDIETASEAVSKVLDELLQAGDFDKPGLNEGSPDVQRPCPIAPTIFEPDTRLVLTGTIPTVKGLRVVDNPSPYVIAVFLVSPDVQGEYFGRDLPLVTEESIRSGNHVLIGTTTGLYLTPEEARDENWIESLVRTALTLDGSIRTTGRSD